MWRDRERCVAPDGLRKECQRARINMCTWLCTNVVVNGGHPSVD